MGPSWPETIMLHTLQDLREFNDKHGNSYVDETQTPFVVKHVDGRNIAVIGPELQSLMRRAREAKRCLSMQQKLEDEAPSQRG